MLEQVNVWYFCLMSDFNDQLIITFVNDLVPLVQSIN